MATIMQVLEILLAFVFWILNLVRIGFIGILISAPIVTATMWYLAKHPNANPFDNSKQD